MCSLTLIDSKLTRFKLSKTRSASLDWKHQADPEHRDFFTSQWSGNAQTQGSKKDFFKKRHNINIKKNCHRKPKFHFTPTLQLQKWRRICCWENSRARGLYDFWLPSLFRGRSAESTTAKDALPGDKEMQPSPRQPSDGLISLRRHRRPGPRISSSSSSPQVTENSADSFKIDNCIHNQETRKPLDGGKVQDQKKVNWSQANPRPRDKGRREPRALAAAVPQEDSTLIQFQENPAAVWAKGATWSGWGTWPLWASLLPAVSKEPPTLTGRLLSALLTAPHEELCCALPLYTGAALFRDNSPTTQFTYLKCTCHRVTIITTSFRKSSSPQNETPCPLAVYPLLPHSRQL